MASPLALECHESRLMHGNPRRLVGRDLSFSFKLYTGLWGLMSFDLRLTSKNSPKSIAETGMMVVAAPPRQNACAEPC
jgi:hypothetical protein